MKAKLLMLLIIPFLAVSCGGGSSATKEHAISRLRTLQSALESKKFEDAIPLFVVPKEHGAIRVRDLEPMAERKELTAAGIDRLEKEGKWGSMREVFGDRGPRMAERFGLADSANCFGLSDGKGEAAFYWDGKQLLIFRCDDIN